MSVAVVHYKLNCAVNAAVCSGGEVNATSKVRLTEWLQKFHESKTQSKKCLVSLCVCPTVFKIKLSTYSILYSQIAACDAKRCSVTTRQSANKFMQYFVMENNASTR